MTIEEQILTSPNKHKFQRIELYRQLLTEYGLTWSEHNSHMHFKIHDVGDLWPTTNKLRVNGNTTSLSATTLEVLKGFKK